MASNPAAIASSALLLYTVNDFSKSARPLMRTTNDFLLISASLHIQVLTKIHC
jgi:hypothetical protein